MGYDHSQRSRGQTRLDDRRRLLAVLAGTVTILIAEVAGAMFSGSLALFADAGHMLTDVAAITLALLAITFAARPPTQRRTFGYFRIEILAALVNALLLLAVAAFVLSQAWHRWQHPTDIDGALMLAFATLGLAANLVGVLLLRQRAQANLNIKGAYLEALSDSLGSLAAMIAALAIMASGWLRADALASVVVALLILPRTWALLRDAIDVLLEAVPANVDYDDVRQHILDTPGVIGAHDLHIWTITSGMPVLSAHVVVADDALSDGGGGQVLDALGACLAGHFDVDHCTFQIEPASHAAHESTVHH